MRPTPNTTRREFMSAAASAAGGLLLAGCAGSAMTGSRPAAGGAPPEDVTPPEDLMREHGLLRRILLVYGAAATRLDAKEKLPPTAVPESANIIRTFIEQYHEKLEEDFLFPRFRKANTLVDLVDVLFAQHLAGRKLTDDVLRLTAPAAATADAPAALAKALRQFIRMYAPHAAREDTVLFPAFGDLLTAKEYDELGDAFETKEHELFGDKGFEKMVDRVAGIEKTMGIYDLAQFTPNP